MHHGLMAQCSMNACLTEHSDRWRHWHQPSLPFSPLTQKARHTRHTCGMQGRDLWHFMALTMALPSVPNHLQGWPFGSSTSPSKKATQKGGYMRDDPAANCWDIQQGSSTVQCIQDHAFESPHLSPVPPRTHPRVPCWEPRPTFVQMSGSADPPKCQTLPRTPSLEYAVH